MKPDVRTKSVYSACDGRDDGFRVLVTRFRGRGLEKNRYDVWVASLGPTEELLRDVQTGKVGWTEFAKRYRKELLEPAAIDRRNRVIKNHGQKFTLRLLQAVAQRMPVTLLCHCAEDQPHCHRHILKSVLEGKI
jgi:uncharacterized protein YeaO (DUF488 family)